MKTIHNNSKMFQSNEFIKAIGYFTSYQALLKRVLNHQNFADIFLTDRWIGVVLWKIIFSRIVCSLSFSEYNVPRDSIFIGIQIFTHFRAWRCKCAVFLTSKSIHEQSRILWSDPFGHFFEKQKTELEQSI